MSLISLDFPRRRSEENPGCRGDLMLFDGHSTKSSLREKLLEHVLIGELLRSLWRRGIDDIEVLRAEVDSGGYDLVLQANGSVLRHVQLKSSFRGAKTAEVGINVNLAAKPSGCVLWIEFDPETLELGPFLWFGGFPGQPLPPLGSKLGRHTKADSLGRKKVRPGIRIVRRSSFASLPTIDEVAVALFGPPSDGEGQNPLATARWIAKAGYPIGMPLTVDEVPCVRYQLLQGRVYTLTRWRDGSIARGEIDIARLAALAGSTTSEGWYDEQGRYLGDEPSAKQEEPPENG